MADLIAINENTFINPDMISAIEVIETNQGLQLAIYIGDRKYISTRNTAELLNEIRGEDVEEEPKPQEETPRQLWVG